MEPQASNASAKIIAALIIGLLVGFAGGVFWQDRRSAGDEPEVAASSEAASTETSKTTTPTGKAQTASVTTSTMSSSTKPAITAGVSAKALMVEDQSAGSSVEVASLDVKEVVWVAVREEKDGALGNILGAQKAFVGDGQKVTIELLRPTVVGGTYRVVVYSDIGTPAFNYREDVLIEGVEGKFSAK